MIGKLTGFTAADVNQWRHMVWTFQEATTAVPTRTLNVYVV